MSTQHKKHPWLSQESQGCFCLLSLQNDSMKIVNELVDNTINLCYYRNTRN